MSRPLAFSLALLLTLIALQHASAAGPAPKAKPAKRPGQASASVKVANSKKAEQYGEQPYAVYEVPEAIADAPEYNKEYHETVDRRYGEQQHGAPHDSYGEEEHEREHKAYEPAPHDEGYEAPKPAYNPAPCPKAMSADAVENGERAGSRATNRLSAH